MAKKNPAPGPARVVAAIGGFGRLLVSRKTPWQAKALLGLAAAYLLWPLDIVPDWLFVPGLLDDVGVVSLLVWLAMRMIDRTDEAEQPSPGD